MEYVIFSFQRSCSVWIGERNGIEARFAGALKGKKQNYGGVGTQGSNSSKCVGTFFKSPWLWDPHHLAHVLSGAHVPQNVCFLVF